MALRLEVDGETLLIQHETIRLRSVPHDSLIA